jgi:hypothetical protein
MSTIKRFLAVAIVLMAFAGGTAFAKAVPSSVPACCVKGNCCASGACCTLPGCCKSDKSCCDPAKGVCTSACGCPAKHCCSGSAKAVDAKHTKK